MSQHPIHVFSEIGKLKKVMLHRPGKEIENLMPELREILERPKYAPCQDCVLIEMGNLLEIAQGAFHALRASR